VLAEQIKKKLTHLVSLQWSVVGAVCCSRPAEAHTRAAAGDRVL
jgi:hypothetical protein